MPAVEDLERRWVAAQAAQQVLVGQLAISRNAFHTCTWSPTAGRKESLLNGYHVPALTSADNNYAPNATVLAIAERAAGLIMSR
jgi:hypothetical protein